MKHDYSEPAYCKALRHLFHPGNGVPPPLLAGREGPLGVLEDLLQQLTGRSAPDKDAVLYGPRGNGKTVLLRAFEETCRDAGVHVVELRPKLTNTPADMAGLLLHNDDDAMATLLETAKPDSMALGLPGIGGAFWKQLPQAEKDALRVRHLQGLLRVRCRKAPLVVTLDEAHTLDLGLGATLLNLSEALRKQGAPLLLVLSGTPNLEGRLHKMDATFWGRSEMLPIGRISEAATKEALEKPLSDLSVSFAPAALDEVAADSQCYPYFIQLWGRSLCDVLVSNQSGYMITPEVVAEAYVAVQTSRTRYYGNRYREMVNQGLTAAADVVAGFFAARSAHHYDALVLRLAGVLGLEEAASRAQIDQLSDLGYLWRPTGRQETEAGIPSLMTHVQDEVQAMSEVQ